MGLFGRGKSGGVMNVIRCDEKEYLVWKWRPAGQSLNSTSRENAIRYNSSLRVREGEVAVFVYDQKHSLDFIEGPYDEMLKTANLPVLSSIVGLGFGGESPFQAEVYFINLQSNNQIRFAVPYFDVFDPRLPDHGIPMAVRGTITFNITDYRNFVKLYRLTEFSLDDLHRQIKDAISRYIKSVVMNIPSTMGIPAVQMESRVMQITDTVVQYLRPRIETDFGVNLKGLDISALEIDKESEYYEQVRHLTAGNTARTLDAQTDVNIQNLRDTQAINAENMAETLRIQREEMHRAQRLQTESANMGAFAVEQQTEVLRAGAESLGRMGTIDGGSGGAGGINPAAMMAGMMMGGAFGQQMAGMMNNMGQQMQGAMNPAPTPPPLPSTQYFVAVNGQQAGPYTIQQLQQFAATGQFTPQTYVWRQGMAAWETAGSIPELAGLFAPPAPGSTPPPPPIP